MLRKGFYAPGVSWHKAADLHSSGSRHARGEAGRSPRSSSAAVWLIGRWSVPSADARRRASALPYVVSATAGQGAR